MMRQFKRILVHIDNTGDSAGTLHRAIDLAKANGAAIKVAFVVQDPPWYVRTLWPEHVKVHEIIEHDSRHTLDDAAARCKEHGLDAATAVLHGQLAIELIREVLRERHDLLMLAASGHRDSAGRLLSASDMRLLRKCPCPVWAFRPGARTALKHVLAAVDVTDDDVDDEAINRRVLELAGDLAREEDGQLHVIHAWSLYLESILRNRISEEEYRETLQRAHDERRAKLDALLARCGLDLPPDQVHLVKGEPRLVVPECASRSHVDLVVLGTLVRTGVGALMGSTAESTLRRAHCSVLAIKPASFVSPVKLE